MTGYLENMTSYLLSPSTNTNSPFPIESNYITLYWSGLPQNRGLTPGDYDRKLLEIILRSMLMTIRS